ncbi:hypothetical protein SALBM217S_04230 [Streptomyces griseoloalbus]
MPELRVVAVSNDGTRLVLKAADSTEYTLPIDERLRAAVRGDRPRLGQIEIEVESHLRPRDIQARIRAGATAEEVAQMAGIPVDRVRRFEGPVLAERAFMAERARKTPVRRPGENLTVRADSTRPSSSTGRCPAGSSGPSHGRWARTCVPSSTGGRWPGSGCCPRTGGCPWRGRPTSPRTTWT